MNKVIFKIKEKRNIKELYDWQKEFFEKFGDLDKSVIVNAPTGAGKTIIAEAYILKCLQDGKKAVYIAPLRSLSFEKYNDWKKIYRWNIHLESGDFVKKCDNPDVYIFTFEKFLLKVVKDRKFVDEIGLVVVDEIHSLIEGDRGSMLEFVLSLVKDKTIVGLSATVKNLSEIAKWLGCDVFSSVSKVVNIDVKFIYNGIIYDKYYSEVGKGDWLDVVVSKILEGKRVIVFVSKRSDTKRLASVISKRLSEVSIENESDDEIVDIFGLPAQYGVAYHNGAMNSEVRKMVEDGFKNGNIRCIVATKTLAMGVNLPADVVVIKDLFYFENGEMKLLKVIDVWQMIGRAGRHTKHGEAYIVAGRKKGMLRVVINKYLYPDYELVRSKLIWSKYFKLMILYAIKYLGGEIVKDDLYELFNETYFRQFFVDGDVILKEAVDIAIGNLILDGFVDEKSVGFGSVYALTELGELVCRFCVEPDIVIKFLNNIEMFEEKFNYDEIIAWLVIEGVFGYISIRRGDLKKYIDVMFRINNALKVSGITNPDDNELARILKTISKLFEWIGGGDVEELILLDIDSGLRYINLFKILSKKECREGLYEKFDNLYYMLKYGLPEEYVPYLKQRGVGRKKAKEMMKRMLKVR